ncbi:internal virion protein with endolysin domain [Pseudomonas phage phiNV3]|uniref:Putative internal core protein n=1 Tax=Pseudomonas phage phiNV3 TaxID=2079544 RepID=A0A2P0ZLK3_9CAUD|nr:virion protein [Pseudomonas tolaasii]YP_009799018.1 internal virion protein with endolysin domain [Pseudomonas phage phiNV3]ARB30297.1 virion protein [Pseudomonas tolaasii]AVH86147.1 putative internal core protein [Pseudomonas phage phiNV3]
MATQAKGKLTPQNPMTPTEILAAPEAATPVQGVGLDAIGGSLVQGQVALGQEANAASLAAIKQEQDRSALDTATALLSESTVTGRALDEASQWFGPERTEIDRSFNPGTYAEKRFAELGIPHNERYAKAIAQAADADDAEQIISRIQQHEENQRVVEQNPYWNFAATMVDPVALAMDAVTFGTGRALRLGRGGMALVGGSGQLGYVAAMDATDMDVDGSTYLLAGALGAGIGAVVGKGAARAAARSPEPVIHPAAVPEVPPTPMVPALAETPKLNLESRIKTEVIPTINRQADAFEDALVAGAHGKTAAEAARFLGSHADVPAPLRAVAAKVAEALDGMAAAGQTSLFKVIRGGDTAHEMYLRPGTGGLHSTSGMESLVSVRGASAAGRVGTNPVTALHELTHAATVQIMRAAEKDLSSVSAAAQDSMRLLTQTLDQVKAHLTDTPDSALSDFAKDLKAGRSNALANRMELVAWGMTDPRMQRLLESVSVPDKGSLWDALVQTVRGLLGLAPEAATALSNVLLGGSKLLEESAGYTAQMATWANKGAPVAAPAYEAAFEGTKAAAKATTGFVNRFFSEADLLGINPEARAMMGRLIDDPVRREGYSTNDNAASFLRRYRNEFDGYVKQYEDAVADLMGQRGIGWKDRALNTKKSVQGRDAVNDEVATELLRRNREWTSQGFVSDKADLDPAVKKIADISDDIHSKMGARAKEAGVRGFEDFQPHPGYFHRSWNYSKMLDLDNVQPGLAAKVIGEAVRRGLKGLDADDALTISKAIVQRAKDRASGIRSEFMGALGVADTTFIRESLEAAGVSEVKRNSIMGKIEQKASDQGTVKYGKGRLNLDMDVEVNVSGQVYRVADLIDRDVDRLLENYAGSISGRSALARAGMPGDSEIEAFIREYTQTVSHMGLAKTEELTGQLRGVFGDFTGNVPKEHQLGPIAQRAAGLTSATMLGFSGVYQLAELATIMHRQGVAATMGEMMQSFGGGMRKLLGQAARDPDLASEMQTVLGLDLARDVRMKPWKRQFDTFLSSSDTTFDRLLHSGKQATPILNGMKFIHGIQSRMNANLTLNKVARAAAGDADALAVLKAYGKDVDWDPLLKRVHGYVSLNGRNATSMNWGQWAKADVDTVMNTALRIMDDSLLYGRVGQNAGYARSPVGQMLGQFRSFVAFAHNKLLRGTYENQGVLGVASLLALQYPLTSMMLGVKAAINGKLDLSETGLKKMATDGISYTAGLGFTADMWGIVNGNGRMSAPVFGLAENTGEVFRGVKGLFGDDQRAAAGDIASGAAGLIPFVNVFPASKLLIESIKGE